MKHPKWIKSSLARRSRRLIFISLVIVAVIAVSLVLFNSGVNNTIEEFSGNMLAGVSGQLKVALHTKLDALLDSLEVAARMTAIAAPEDREGLIELLKTTAEMNDFDHVVVTMRSGETYSSDGSEPYVLGLEFFYSALGGERTVTEPMSSANSDSPDSLVLAVPIDPNTHNGYCEGVVWGSYKINVLNEILQTDLFSGEGRLCITDGRGRIILRSNDSAILDGYDSISEIFTAGGKESEAQNLRAAMKTRSSGSEMLLLPGGARVVYYEPFDIKSWYIYSFVPYSQAAKTYSGVRVSGYLLAAIIFASFLLILIEVFKNNSRSTEAIRREKDELALSEERYRIITEQYENVIIEMELSAKSLTTSQGYERLFGAPCLWTYSGASLKMPNLHREDSALPKRLVDELTACARASGELRLMRADGTYIWCLLRLSLIRDNAGAPKRILGTLTDIDRDKSERQQLIRTAESDPMTGLYNKAAAPRIAGQRLLAGGRHFLMVLDVDNFKGVNDNFGHLFGDEVLKMIADRLRRLFRSNDIIARIGGDEYVVFISEISCAALERKAATLCETFRKPFTHGDTTVKISVSVGIAQAPTDADTYDELLLRSDAALYAAKQAGKDRYCIYHEGMTFPGLVHEQER